MILMQRGLERGRIPKPPPGRLTVSDDAERGSALLVILLLMVSVGAIVTAHLTVLVHEQKKIEMRYHAQRAMAEAVGQLEFARNIVNNATYTSGANEALTQAIAASPSVVAGTDVLVTRVAAGSPWYRLRASATVRGVTKVAQVFVRDQTPVSGYNLFVMDHPVGVSGAPRGDIHSNKTVDFYFPWGLYRDSVTAVEGFNYLGGASETNTRLQGPYNPHAPYRNLLDNWSVADVAAQADTLSVTDDLIAEIEFQGTQTEVRLYSRDTTVMVDMTGERQVFDHYDSVPYDVQVPVYRTETYTVDQPVYEWQQYFTYESTPVYRWDDVEKTRTVPVYEDQVVTYTVDVPIYDTRTVTRTREVQVWVEAEPPPPEEMEGSSTVASGEAPELGYWQTTTETYEEQETYISGYNTETRTRTDHVKVSEYTETYTESVKVLDHYDYYWKERWRQVQTGTQTVEKTRQVLDHYDTVTQYQDVPVYRTETYTYQVPQVIPGELVETDHVPTEGVIYVTGEVRSIGGQINGQVTIATDSTVNITDSLVYVDDDGDTRMLNGTDPTQRYLSNPDYHGHSVLGIMADGDITYSQSCPERLEINASLVSLNGKVAFEGIDVSDDGTEVSADTSTPEETRIKDSIRRLGGVVSRKRPVATYVGADHSVLAGFETGMALMDRNLLVTEGGLAPPGMFQEAKPVWSMMSVGQYIPMH